MDNIESAVPAGDLDEQIERIRAGGVLSLLEFRLLCAAATDQLLRTANVVTVSSPLTVCGDIHGQFYDLLQLFSEAGDAPATRFVFLGDYVDRGAYSLETLCLLVLLMVRWPGRVVLLRGNHESRQITTIYGFYDECVRKHGGCAGWRAATDLFDALPVAAVVDDAVLCVHGGLSPTLTHIDELRVLDRLCEVPHEGTLCDVLWSDPGDTDGWRPSPRGAGWLFGADRAMAFVHDNGLEFVARAHQLAAEGYKLWFGDRVLTVWSAPNYCYRCNNHAAFLSLGADGQRCIRRFQARAAGNRGVSAKVPVPQYFL
eukprot:TRINITY_DN8926_c0_g1_i2.p1 TRINITY_DN8926_c0_g1~~TRINITY_DN8926_c0_g1_i2.p1  ORF type:complete len:314 (+),score=50.09 TRINITY_DN8926_c0_g1_i2:120-1061(+)